MTQNHSNTRNVHVTEIERGQIATYLDERPSAREIGRRMRYHSSILREIKRGTVKQIDTFRKPYTKYFPDVAARVYQENHVNCGNHSKMMKAWEFNVFRGKKEFKLMSIFATPMLLGSVGQMSATMAL